VQFPANARFGVPLLFASSVCPKEVYPPANDGQFCTTAFAATYDSRAALAFIKETAKAGLAYVAIIPCDYQLTLPSGTTIRADQAQTSGTRVKIAVEVGGVLRLF
jgi:hypothetical protein